MKKLVLVFIVFISIFGISNSFAYNMDNLFQKIDVIYENNPDKLEALNYKIESLMKRRKNLNDQIILREVNNYINYKFKNEKFYEQDVSSEIKLLVENIRKESFTDQEELSKLNEALEKNDISLIDKEYLY